MHERMPVMLSKDQAWNMGGWRAGVDLHRLLSPSIGTNEAYPVGPYVSNRGMSQRNAESR